MAVFGDTLRQARAHKGVTLKEAEQATRLSRHHLLALEEEKFDELPALIYQRGFVRNYATYLDLDPNKLLSMFETARGGGPDDAPLVTPSPTPEVPSHWAPNFAIIAFLVVMSAVVFAWMYSVYFAPDGQAVAPTELVPTVTPVSIDTIFMPTTTPVPPTATTTATSEPTLEPTIVVQSNDSTVSAGPADATDTSGGIDQSSDVQDFTPVPAATEAQSGAYTFTFYAAGDLESLQIVADGAQVWDAPLVQGDATGYISANSFQIYVSNPDALEIVKKGGDSFSMGDQYFELP